MTDVVSVSLGLAFVAGLVSFLSPCVFPIVPSYVGFVTGLTLEELREGNRTDARRQAAERDLGLLLPCNVVVYASDEPGRSVIAAMDPEAAMEMTGNAEVREVAKEVKARLERVLGGVAQ